MKRGSHHDAERIFICQYQMKNLQRNLLWAASEPKQYLSKSNLIIGARQNGIAVLKGKCPTVLVLLSHFSRGSLTQRRGSDEEEMKITRREHRQTTICS